MQFKPYTPCVGRKYRAIPKLYRPFVILISGNFCNEYFTEKNKIRFIGQWLRWFYKSRWGYKMEFSIDMNKGILEGDSIIICGRTQKAAWKNLLKKLNYELCDYEALKRRQYILNFTFLFLNINEICNNSIYLDIISSHEDIFKILIIVNGYYISDFNNILYYSNNIDLMMKIEIHNNGELKEVSNFNFDIFFKSMDIDFNDPNFNFLFLFEDDKKRKNYDKYSY